ncbi:hypothetical protein [Absidia glauca]|uniref:F-box domain-containing protein n=1 Tax=Absidia glauca TaxID=4829 RepID=A0A168PG91_ABSGL|nr:hypothetical protein [Absidia glauca]
MASVILLVSTYLSRFVSSQLAAKNTLVYTIQQEGEQLIQHGHYVLAYRLFVGLHDLLQRLDPQQSQQWQQQRDLQLCLRYQLICLHHLGKHQQALDLCNTVTKSNPTSTWYDIAADIYTKQLRFDEALVMVQRYSAHLLPDHSEPRWNEVRLQERILYEGIQQRQQREMAPLDDSTLLTLDSTPAPTDIATADKLDLVYRLPYDLVCSIFSRLPLNNLVTCAKVNRTWRRLIVSNPLFWQHLILYHKPLPNHIIDLYLSRLQCAPLLSLRIQNEQDVETVLATLCKSNCSQLDELECASLQCATKECWYLFRQVIISAGRALRILRLGSSNFKLDNIILLASESCAGLEILDLNDCFVSVGNYPSLVPTSPSLQPSDDSGFLQRLEHFGGLFSDTYIDSIALLPPLALRQLRLSGIHGLTATHLAAILLRCPDLIELTLENCMVNIIPVINILCYSCPRLEQLHYHRNNFGKLPITESSLSPIPSSSPRWQRRWQRFQSSLETTTETMTARNRQLASNIATDGATSTQHHYDHQNTPLSAPHSTTYSSYRNDKDRSFWKQLSLKQTRSLTDDLLHFILVDSYHTVEHLDLTGNTQLGDNCIYNMIQQGQGHQHHMGRRQWALSAMVECSFANCLKITELGLCSFVEHAPRLLRLDLSGLSGVTDVVLLSIALHCPSLSSLRLCHCRSITDSGIRCFIDKVQQLHTIGKPWLLQQVDLAHTNISLDSWTYLMCHIQQNGI